MPTAITLKWWLITGLVLMAMGLGRLFSAYLVSSQAATWFTRILVGTFCIIGGAVFVVLGRSANARVRTEG